MSLQENIKNIIFYYIKKRYTEHLRKENIKSINDEEIHTLINNLYTDEKEGIQKYIRNCLKEMYLEDYNSVLIENIIFDIFDDEELAKNRVIMEIKSFQEHQKNKDNIYEIDIKPDEKYGLGLKLDFEPHDIIISNFKRDPDTKKELPAEKTNISIGDSIIEINNVSLLDKTTQECMEIFKEQNYKHEIRLKLKTYTEKNKLCILE